MIMKREKLFFVKENRIQLAIAQHANALDLVTISNIKYSSIKAKLCYQFFGCREFTHSWQMVQSTEIPTYVW